ncbi:MAG: response regulator [Nitrospiraceae bacterium]|nr:response regulator [Nitrospiraceae bacterium]
MRKKKILVIDDEEIVLQSCRRTLEPEGYEVKTVRSGTDGIILLENESFDLVLTDLKMPDMDGIKILCMIKESWPSVEVVIITGYQTVETAVSALKLGAFDYLEKPFTPDQILSAINNVFMHKTKQQ